MTSSQIKVATRHYNNGQLASIHAFVSNTRLKDQNFSATFSKAKE